MLLDGDQNPPTFTSCGRPKLAVPRLPGCGRIGAPELVQLVAPNLASRPGIGAEGLPLVLEAVNAHFRRHRLSEVYHQFEVVGYAGLNRERCGDDPRNPRCPVTALKLTALAGRMRSSRLSSSSFHFPRHILPPPRPMKGALRGWRPRPNGSGGPQPPPRSRMNRSVLRFVTSGPLLRTIHPPKAQTLKATG